MLILFPVGIYPFEDGSDDWSLYLNIIMYAYNTTPNNMTTFAPSQIIFGLNPCYNNTPDINDIPLADKLSREYINFITNRINIIRNKANIAQNKYDTIRKKSYDKNSSDKNYEIGQDVMYNISSRYTGNKRKLNPNYIGPYEIIDVFNDGQSYTIQNKYDNNIINVHRKHIRPFTDQFILQNSSPIILLMDTLNHNKSSLDHTASSLYSSASGYENVADVFADDIVAVVDTNKPFQFDINNNIDKINNVDHARFEPCKIYNSSFDLLTQSLKGVNKELLILAWQLDNITLRL